MLTKKIKPFIQAVNFNQIPAKPTQPVAPSEDPDIVKRLVKGSQDKRKKNMQAVYPLLSVTPSTVLVSSPKQLPLLTITSSDFPDSILSTEREAAAPSLTLEEY